MPSIARSLLLITVIVCPASVASNARAALDDGLIGYWQFDGNGEDSSPFGRDVDLIGNPGFAAGLFGEALDLHNNGNQYAQRPVDDDAFDPGRNDFSIQVWVNYYDLQPGDVLVEKWGGCCSGSWTLFSNPSGYPLLVFATGPFYLENNFFEPSEISNGVWHQIVVSRRRDEWGMYFDGNEVGRRVLPGENIWSTDQLIIGRRTPLDGRGDQSVDGRLDEIAIWSRALGSAEIRTIYNNGAGRPIVEQREPVPGDTDGDFDVDLDDLNTVRNYFGISGGPGIPGDVDGDGGVGLEDLNLVRNHFGTTAGAAVPEPGAIVLQVIGAAGIWFASRRRSRWIDRNAAQTV